MAACSESSSAGLRDRALIAFLFSTGMRISEALALLPRDVDLAGLSAVVQCGKGGRRRLVGVLPDAVAPVEAWLARRRLLGVDDRCVIFCTITTATLGADPTRPGRPLSREHVGRVLRRLARRAGILKRVHPHGFRHAHTVMLRARGLDLYALKVQLGHRFLNTTDRYCHLLGAHELPDKLRAMGPVLNPPEAGPRRALGDLLAHLSDRDAADLVRLLGAAGR